MKNKKKYYAISIKKTMVKKYILGLCVLIAAFVLYGLKVQNDKNSVTFAKGNGTIYLRYRGIIYQEGLGEAESINLQADSYKWNYLISAPYGLLPKSDNDLFNKVFNFRLLPNKQDFIFVMRYTYPEKTKLEVLKQEFKTYYYQKLPNKDQVTLLFSYPENGKFAVPLVDQIDAEGRYIAFSLHPCWNCDAYGGGMLVYDLQTKTSKNIGRVSYFTWKKNGNYEYKEYKTIPCPPEVTNPADGFPYLGPPCEEKPENLPLKTSHF